MTTVTESGVATVLRRAAVRATRAPSIHNTQPWRFVIRGPVLQLWADPDRRLRVLDPHGRQLLLSCGCALFNARVSLAAAGCAAVVRRFPDPAQPDLLAEITIDPDSAAPADDDIACFANVIDLRQTNRRRFHPDPVHSEVVDSVVQAAEAEGAEVMVVTRPEDRLAVAALSQQADQIENADPAYRAEIRAWTSDDPSRVDGVPAYAAPRVDGTADDDVPIRDFDARGTASLPAHTASGLNQCFVLVGALEDNRMAWLRAGEALERVLLEVTRWGHAASFFTQIIEVARTNVLLRQELRLAMHPHVMLRIGRAERTPITRRRRLVDVLAEDDA